MSSIKARLMKPTGLEFHDTAFELDREIWNFIKHEYKNKSKNENGELPVRYWQTHAVPIHRNTDQYFHQLFGVWPNHRKGGKKHGMCLYG